MEKYGEVWRKVWRSMEILMNHHFSCKKDKFYVFEKVWRKVWRSMEKYGEKYGEVWRFA